jgi:hypothetical protein
MGVGTVGLYGDLPLIIALSSLQIYLYQCGLRAPVMSQAAAAPLLFSVCGIMALDRATSWDAGPAI